MADGFGGSSGNFNSSGFGNAGTGYMPSLAPGLAMLQNGNQNYQQRNQLAQDKYNTDVQAGTARQGFATQLGTAQIGANAQTYGYDQATRQAQIGADAQRYGADQNTVQAGIAADAAKYPAMLKQQRWDQLSPYVTGILGGLQNGGTGGAFGAGGLFGAYQGQGQVGTQPQINAAPVYSQDQIQQQVNTARANNDQKTAGEIQQMNNSLGGHGYGSNSPLAAVLGASYQGQNMQANTANETSTRLNAAQMNSQQLLAAQQAQEAQFANRQNEDIQRGQVKSNLFGSLFGSILGSAA